MPRDELVDAWVELYVWQHLGWATEVSVPALRPRMAALVDASDRGLSIGAWVGDRLAASVLVVPGEGPTGVPDFVDVIAETVRQDEPDGTALLAAALAETFRALAAAGVPAAALDGHLTDPHLDPVTRTLPPDVPTDPLHVARLDPGVSPSSVPAPAPHRQQGDTFRG